MRTSTFAQLTKHYAMNAYGGVDVKIHDFLNSALVREVIV
jgi:hypothetical protein